MEHLEQIQTIVYEFITYKIGQYIQHNNIQYIDTHHLLKILYRDDDKMWMEYAVNRDEDGDVNDYMRENNYDILDTMTGHTMFQLIQYVKKQLYDNYGMELDISQMTPNKLICQYAYCVGNFDYELAEHINEIQDIL